MSGMDFKMVLTAVLIGLWLMELMLHSIGVK